MGIANGGVGYALDENNALWSLQTCRALSMSASAITADVIVRA